MSLSEGLTKAIARVHDHFFTDPSMALRPWIDVEASTAHDAIGLLHGLLSGSIDSIVIRNTPAFFVLRTVAVQRPWNEVLCFDTAKQKFSLSAAAVVHERELLTLLSRYNKPIEKTSPDEN